MGKDLAVANRSKMQASMTSNKPGMCSNCNDWHPYPFYLSVNNVPIHAKDCTIADNLLENIKVWDHSHLDGCCIIIFANSGDQDSVYFTQTDISGITTHEWIPADGETIGKTIERIHSISYNARADLAANLRDNIALVNYRVDH